MFGYVVVNTDRITLEEKKQYKAFYCGLCKTLGTRHGIISRFTLTYDMTFLVLFLSAIYKTDNIIQTERCIIHPLKPHEYCLNEISKYAADMNVILAYYNFLDDWTDDKNVLSLSAAKLFERQYKRIEAQYPNQCTSISKCLAELYKIEKSGELNPDVPANCFGKLMGEIFVLREDEYAQKLRTFGTSLGKFIYIMDGCMDLKSDIINERYNPMITSSFENFYDILNLLMADCIKNYKKFSINQDKGLIENILYSGVWTKYEAERKKKKGVHK